MNDKTFRASKAWLVEAGCLFKDMSGKAMIRFELFIAAIIFVIGLSMTGYGVELSEGIVDCSYLGETTYDDNNIVFCLSNIGGNPHDIWFAIRKNEESSLSRLYFSYANMVDLFGYDKIMFPRINPTIDSHIDIFQNGRNIDLAASYEDSKWDEQKQKTISIDIEKAMSDDDKDGLSYYEEKRYGTSPVNKDSDGDGKMDGYDHNPSYRDGDKSEICQIYRAAMIYEIYVFNIVSVFFKDGSECSLSEPPLSTIVIKKSNRSLIPVFTVHKPKYINSSEVEILVDFYEDPKSSHQTKYVVKKTESGIWEKSSMKILSES